MVFPQTELGGDTEALRTFGQRVEELGFAHLAIFDHVIGADPAIHKGWTGAYDIDNTFHEPMTALGFLAAITTTVELSTAVIILPQRQTALLAKQAAEVDLLSGGRFRFGIGMGWNAVEFEALGEDFTNRGKRSEEQVELMRRLWTERSITFDGRYHRVTGAGIAPLPVQRPIPVWFGVASRRGYERAGRLGDGWMPMVQPGEGLEEAQAIVERAAVAAGRDPAAIGVEGQIWWRGDRDDFLAKLDAWSAAGASHGTVIMVGAGLSTLDEHLEALDVVAEAVRSRSA